MSENATILAEIQRISLIHSPETAKSGKISIENIPTAILKMLHGQSILRSSKTAFTQGWVQHELHWHT